MTNTGALTYYEATVSKRRRLPTSTQIRGTEQKHTQIQQLVLAMEERQECKEGGHYPETRLAEQEKKVLVFH